MCLACQTQPKLEQMNAFAERFLSIINESALSLMLSIGHRTGLFETMKGLPDAYSSEQIAEAAQLNERYVREWLGAMVAGGIVEVDDAGQRYHLPASHAAMLTESGEGECLAHLAQYIAILGSVENEIVTCFKQGGGVSYAAYPRFHEVMAQESRQSVVGVLESHILPLVPGLMAKLEAGIEVLDIGCGRGYALRTLAARFPRSRFTGFDLSEDAIAFAEAESHALELRNVRFVQRDLTSFHQEAEPERFDLITAFDAIHDQARPDHVLAGIQRTLRRGGTFLMQDIGGSSNVAENRDHPLGPLIYTISCMHCMTVSLAQGGLGVGAAWGEAMTREFLAAAGFKSIQRHTLEHDIQNYYYVAS